ncbi:MAG: RsmB/NOP family class I SAM-dependent RNA methyltransferase [Verrucomicrobiota bacterium]|nr:RsmB/NOP family class I SAM-dependent RNA methyltransferase [Verrucomicrobiota bacterium]
MENNIKPNALPEKVVRRHSEMLAELLPGFSQLVMEEGRPVDALLNAHLRSHRELGSRDRRFLSQALFSYFRWYGWTVAKLHLGLSEAALVGTALDVAELPQSFQYLETRCKLPFTIEAMGNRSVEEKRAALNDLFKDTENFQPLELADLVFPEFGSVVDPDVVDRCMTEFQQRPPTWLRCRTDPAILGQALAAHDVPSSSHQHVTAALSIEGGVSLANALASHASQFVVQDIASQCVGLACAPQKGDDWWDCCAGAGGKALHLMDLMQQDGKVLASDIRTVVIKELKKRARRYGIKHIRTQPFNAVNDEPFTKTFDGVLVDAPCSGWGTWGRNPDARWRASRRDVVQCASRQLKILNNVKWCVKPGGTLVYAVCTFTRPETEEVVMNFLDQHTNFKLAPFANPLTGEPTDGQLQIWPWDAAGDGMFITRFVRDPE